VTEAAPADKANRRPSGRWLVAILAASVLVSAAVSVGGWFGYRWLTARSEATAVVEIIPVELFRDEAGELRYEVNGAVYDDLSELGAAVRRTAYHGGRALHPVAACTVRAGATVSEEELLLAKETCRASGADPLPAPPAH
jgi:hypothetical protein